MRVEIKIEFVFDNDYFFNSMAPVLDSNIHLPYDVHWIDTLKWDVFPLYLDTGKVYRVS